MPSNLDDTVKAGALAALCFYHRKLGGCVHHWENVREFAYREFRDVASEVIEKLIVMAKESRIAGCALKSCDRDKPLCVSLIPRTEGR